QLLACRTGWATSYHADGLSGSRPNPLSVACSTYREYAEVQASGRDISRSLASAGSAPGGNVRLTANQLNIPFQEARPLVDGAAGFRAALSQLHPLKELMEAAKVNKGERVILLIVLHNSMYCWVVVQHCTRQLTPDDLRIEGACLDEKPDAF